METQITIREAITEKDAATFWEQLHMYHKRDIFPDPQDEDRDFFLSDTEYRTQIEAVHDRPQDRLYYLFFQRNGQDIGFAMPVIFTSEDGKCFIMEFCVYPEHRGGGTGHACARALLAWARARGARYAELNYGSDDRRRRFWQSIGFMENGVDEWGEPLMLLPPEEDVPFTVERLEDPDDFHLWKLENGFLRSIGEDTLTEEKQERLKQAVKEGNITFFMAKRGYRAVGMCSICTHYSTFGCADVGVFDDFYIEPAFRHKGIARLLATAVQSWCRDRGIASVSVCCAPCDEPMYRALGFDTHLGMTLAHIE